MTPQVALKPTLSVPQAIERLRKGPGRLWPWRRRSLLDAFLIDIPFRPFNVRVRNAGREDGSCLAIDAATGGLDLYRLDWPLDPADLEATDAPALPAAVSVGRLRELLLERVRRQVYQKGFFRVRNLEIELEDLGQELRMPYWVGVYRTTDRRPAIEVLAAARSAWEGAKVRDAVEQWLAAGGIEQPV